MPRFAANVAWLFTEQPFLERFRAAREAGFAAVEFRSPYEHPAPEVAERIARERLGCVLFNLPMGDAAKGDVGIACRPGREAEFRESVAKALDYARLIRPERINCIAGKALPGEDRAALEAVLVENLRFALAQFKPLGIPMLLEPINDRDTPGYLVPRQDDGARVIEAVGDAALGLQCDLYHVAMMGDDPSRMLARHRGIVRHVQFADAPGRGEPGTGTVPLRQAFDSLDNAGYTGWVSAEYRPTRATRETLGWMQSLA
jgi:hydroxypyruvate isomerase